MNEQNNSHGPSRRALLQAGTVLGAATAVGALGTGYSLRRRGASSRTPTSPTRPMPATSVARIFKGFFSAKSRHDPDTMMTYFSKTDAFYIDASSGNVWPSAGTR